MKRELKAMVEKQRLDAMTYIANNLYRVYLMKKAR